MKLKPISLLLMTAFAAAAQDAKPNFSGTWQYIELGRVLETDRIQHNDPDFAITKAVGRADVLYTFTYRTDGGEPKSERCLR